MRNLLRNLLLTYGVTYCVTYGVTYCVTYGKKGLSPPVSLIGLVGVDGRLNGSFNFLFTLWVYRTCIDLLTYVFKNTHQNCHGFENLMTSWGVWIWFSKSGFYPDFFQIMLKVWFLKIQTADTSLNDPVINSPPVSSKENCVPVGEQI